VTAGPPTTAAQGRRRKRSIAQGYSRRDIRTAQNHQLPPDVNRGRRRPRRCRKSDHISMVEQQGRARRRGFHGGGRTFHRVPRNRFGPSRYRAPDENSDAKSKPGRPAERRPTKRSATLMETNCSLRRAVFFSSRLPIPLLRHFPFLGARCPSVHALRGGSYGTSIFHSPEKP
jgi:hypothetical protein